MKKSRLTINLRVLSLIGFIIGAMSACGASQNRRLDSSSSELKIIGGKPMRATDPLLKSMVGILDANDEILCTGIVLNDHQVLTAAHCTMFSGFKNLSIQTNMRTRASSTAVKISNVTVHDQFNLLGLATMEPQTPPADLEILETATPLVGVVPIASIVDQADEIAEDAVIRMTGYGRSIGAERSSAGKALYWDFKVESINKPANEMILTDPDIRMACHGDSGGPVFENVAGIMKLVGVVSRGKNECDTNESVVTDLRNYVAWISEVTSAAK